MRSPLKFLFRVLSSIPQRRDYLTGSEGMKSRQL